MFNKLFAITNQPIARFAEDLRQHGQSQREDMLGYRRFGNQGEVLTYVDPVTGETVDAITLFRRRLARQQDANGVITL